MFIDTSNLRENVFSDGSKPWCRFAQLHCDRGKLQVSSLQNLTQKNL